MEGARLVGELPADQRTFQGEWGVAVHMVYEYLLRASRMGLENTRRLSATFDIGDSTCRIAWELHQERGNHFENLQELGKRNVELQ